MLTPSKDSLRSSFPLPPTPAYPGYPQPMPTSPHPDKTPNTTTPKNKKNAAETTVSSNHLFTTSSPLSVARPLDSPTSLPLDRFTAHASHLHQRPVSSRSNSNVIITSTLPTEDHHHHHHHGAHANTDLQGQRSAGPHPHAPSSSSSTSSSSMSVRSFQAQARNVVASWTGFGSTASPVDGPDGNSSSTGAHANHQQNRPSEMMAIAEARLFTQQLMHQQQDSRTSTGSVTGGRSVLGSVMGRGMGASTIGGGTGSGGHSSPVLGGDEPNEQTLLLTRPLWVQDQDAAACRICARTFNAVRRKVLYTKKDTDKGSVTLRFFSCAHIVVFLPTTLCVDCYPPPFIPYFFLLCTRWMGILDPAFPSHPNVFARFKQRWSGGATFCSGPSGVVSVLAIRAPRGCLLVWTMEYGEYLLLLRSSCMNYAQMAWQAQTTVVMPAVCLSFSSLIR